MLPDRDRRGTLHPAGGRRAVKGDDEVSRGATAAASRAGHLPRRRCPGHVPGRHDPGPQRPVSSDAAGPDRRPTGERTEEPTGEPLEFADYVRTRGPHLARVARLLVDDRATAEDLVQAVLVKALASWPRIRRSGDVDAYLRRALVTPATAGGGATAASCPPRTCRTCRTGTWPITATASPSRSASAGRWRGCPAGSARP